MNIRKHYIYISTCSTSETGQKAKDKTKQKQTQAAAPPACHSFGVLRCSLVSQSLTLDQESWCDLETGERNLRCAVYRSALYTPSPY